MKKIIALIALLTLFASPAWAQKVSALPAATTPLAGSELMSLVQGGVSSQAPVSAVSKLAGSTRQIYNVMSFGAKCDGTILYDNVRTTNGSATISSPDYNFTAADIGKQINVAWIANSNGGAQPAHIFIGTITGNSGNNAILNTALNFTSTAYQYASARFYMTDDSTAIQNAFNANGANLQPGYASPNVGVNNMTEMNGGIIQFPAGVCVAKNLTFFSGQRIEGAALGGTNLMLPNGANTDILVSANFANCTGLQYPSGVQNTTIENISLDGNKIDNTGTNQGLQGLGTGDGIRWCGAAMKIHNVAANMFAADGIEVEGWNVAGSPGETGNGMESYYDTITLFYNTGDGFVYNGPTDSYMNNIIAAYNLGGGIRLGSTNNSQGGLIHYVSNSHTYANGTFGYSINLPYTNFVNDIAEGNTSGPGYACNVANSCNFDHSECSNTGGSQCVTTASGVALNATNSSLSPITLGSSNTLNTVLNTYVGTITSGTLNPQHSNLDISNSGANSIWSHSTDSAKGGPFQIIASGGGITFHADDAGQVGIGTATPSTGVSLDVGSRTNSILLPSGTSAQRPTGIAGMLRYNSTLVKMEQFYNSAWRVIFDTPNSASFSAAPTIGSGFCTSPSVATNNGTAAFTINVGTSCSGSTGAITMPAATTKWVCTFTNTTNNATNVVSQSGAGSTTSVPVTNYVRTTGVAGNFTDSDLINAFCIAE